MIESYKKSKVEQRGLASRIAAQAYLWVLLVVLYAPILLIIIFSFTQSKVFGNWTGFTFGLYENLFTGYDAVAQVKVPRHLFYRNDCVIVGLDIHCIGHVGSDRYLSYART